MGGQLAPPARRSFVNVRMMRRRRECAVKKRLRVAILRGRNRAATEFARRPATQERWHSGKYESNDGMIRQNLVSISRSLNTRTTTWR